jgi:hypothetical protein
MTVQAVGSKNQKKKKLSVQSAEQEARDFSAGI